MSACYWSEMWNGNSSICLTISDFYTNLDIKECTQVHQWNRHIVRFSGIVLFFFIFIYLWIRSKTYFLVYGYLFTYNQFCVARVDFFICHDLEWFTSFSACVRISCPKNTFPKKGTSSFRLIKHKMLVKQPIQINQDCYLNLTEQTSVAGFQYADATF